MNNKGDFHIKSMDSTQRPSNPPRRRVRRIRGRSGRITEGQKVGVVDILSDEAARLLTVLGEVRSHAIRDPLDHDAIIATRSKSGISVGAGRFAIAAAEALARHDLARWHADTPSRRILRIATAGRAFLRRRTAGGGADAFQLQHGAIGEMVLENEGETHRVRVNSEESPLAWLRRRKGKDGCPMIDAASYEAGERLRSDITQAGLLPGVTACWDAIPRVEGGPSPSHATDRMVAARQRLRLALDAVGADFADLLLDLCGFLKGLETIERERGWPPRSGKVVVKFALARLAQHYGLDEEARGPGASRGIRAWQAVVIEGGLSQ